MAVFLGALAIFAYSTIQIDHPFKLLDISSRALYVDEGFYADAAQNLVKFGQWDMPLDSRHWPGAPFLAMLQSIVFSVFGVSLTGARLISIILSLISVFALYALCRMRFTPGWSLVVSLSGLVTFNFLGFSRAAIADPTASAMAFIALLIFARLRLRSFAIPLSLLFAFFAFFSKMYFLFALATMVFLWFTELVVFPLIFRDRKFEPSSVGVFCLSLIGLALFYWAFRSYFSEEIKNFLDINSNKTPKLNWLALYYTFDDAFEKMPYHTKSPYMLLVLASAAIFYLLSRFIPSHFKHTLAGIRNLNRADWAVGTYLVAGYVLVGMLSIHKAHYHFFTILPVIYLATSAIFLIFSGWFRHAALGLVLAAHLVHQVPFYSGWVERPNLTSMYELSEDITALIERENPTDDIVPIIGEYSAQAALFSPRMMSLDAKWVSQKALCERIDYWKPKYHVNVVWPKSGSRRERDLIAKCPSIAGYEEIKRYASFLEWKDEIVFTRLHYKKEAQG